MSWDKVKPAKRYVVYAAKSANTPFKKLATVSGNKMSRKQFDKCYKKAFKRNVSNSTKVGVVPELKVGNKYVVVIRDGYGVTNLIK